MRSRTSEQFRNAFEKLPQHIQRNARKAFELWESDSTHPSLKFKQIHSKEQIYSVRIEERNHVQKGCLSRVTLQKSALRLL